MGCHMVKDVQHPQTAMSGMDSTSEQTNLGKAHGQASNTSISSIAPPPLRHQRRHQRYRETKELQLAIAAPIFFIRAPVMAADTIDRGLQRHRRYKGHRDEEANTELKMCETETMHG
ncbi:unnamed protein product [Durusdinium trenchii]|uniref:Uncharacterized protein n=1 Tax=Durusdinium trenchii TaxID=1381693 RepID=A0ABP0NDH5_9DINO